MLCNMSNNNENNINIYPKSWELYDGREYDKWNQSSHYITGDNGKQNIIVMIMRMIQMYIYNENSKKIRAQECSDDNMIAGMASTEIH